MQLANVNWLCYLCYLWIGVQPVPLQTITNENPAGPSLGTIPQARFLLVMLNMLTLQHGANTLSLLLNSGMLALTQTALRLIGTGSSAFLFGRKHVFCKSPVCFTCWCMQKIGWLCCLKMVLTAIHLYPQCKKPCLQARLRKEFDCSLYSFIIFLLSLFFGHPLLEFRSDSVVLVETLQIN